MVIVKIGSELYGDTFAVVIGPLRNTMRVAMVYRPPVGSQLTVHFEHPRDDGEPDEIVARAEVISHRDGEVVLQLLAFEAGESEIEPARIQ